MTVEEQFRSMTLELQSLKDRVYHFRHTKHWQTVGEWKELVLRSVLERHLPRHLEPLRGFVTDGRNSSKQIDVLVYDNTKPCLFRAGDLVFVTPDAVAGIVEVKSTVSDRSKLEAALRPLSSNVEKVRRTGNQSAFAGLFAFDTKLTGIRGVEVTLDCLKKVSKEREERVVDFVCLGSDIFILFWEGQDGTPEVTPSRWRGYLLNDMAPGYFVNNLFYATAADSVQRNIEAWFPHKPKEEIDLRERPIDFGSGVFEPGPKAPGR